MYPSANGQQRGALRFSAKTQEYRRLAEAIERAAKAALADGWNPVTILAEFRITRVAPDRRVRDAMNLGQAEANALTRAGAWSDDCVAAPVLLDTQYDPAGPSRVRIEITRIYQRNDVVRAALKIIG